MTFEFIQLHNISSTMNDFRGSQSRDDLKLLVNRIFAPLIQKPSTSCNQINSDSCHAVLSPRRSSIHLDLSRELENGKNEKVPNESSLCNHCILSLKRPLTTPIAKHQLLGVEHHVAFLRAIIWLKTDACSLQKIPLSNVRTVLENLSTIMNQLTSASDHEDSGVNDLFSAFTGVNFKHQRTDRTINKQRQTLENAQMSYGTILAPDSDREASLNSCPISFGEGSVHRESSITFQESSNVADSGIHDFTNTSSSIFTLNPSTCTIQRPETQHRPTIDATSRKPVEELWKNTPNPLDEETVSSMFISTTLEGIQVNNLALNMMRVILSFLEDVNTAKSYKYGVNSIEEATKTVVDFIDIVSREESVYSSTCYVNFFTCRVMSAVRAILDNLSCKNLTSIEQQYHAEVVLQLCECTQICEQTIDLLLDKLTHKLEEMEDLESILVDDRLPIIDDSAHDFYLSALEVAITKFCTMVQRNAHCFDGSTHYSLIYTWQKLGRRIGIAEERRVRMRALTMTWIERLQALMKLDILVCAGTYGSITRMIAILSNLLV